MLPSFLVIGAMKGGTTSLWQYLKSHPQIYLPPKKEIHFFGYEENWGRGITWYEDLFAAAPTGTLAVGEASTSYAKYPLIDGVPARIAALLPDVRLIYVIRHPIDRMRSHYVDRYEAGEEDASIENALLSDERYLSISRYGMQIERYLDFFDRRQILFITSEALRDQRRSTMRSVFKFLGVDSEWQSPVFDESFYRADAKRHYGPFAQRLRRSPAVRRLAELAPERVKRINRSVAMHPSVPRDVAISGDLRSRLEAALRDDVKRLRVHVGPHFDGWGLA
jgi:Sulfotransferase domain